jgi:uncharacterized membrane protein HdeD (DUF308 family)
MHLRFISYMFYVQNAFTFSKWLVLHQQTLSAFGLFGGWLLYVHARKSRNRQCDRRWSLLSAQFVFITEYIYIVYSTFFHLSKNLFYSIPLDGSKLLFYYRRIERW